jgi:hypothetical protein
MSGSFLSFQTNTTCDTFMNGGVVAVSNGSQEAGLNSTAFFIEANGTTNAIGNAVSLTFNTNSSLNNVINAIALIFNTNQQRKHCYQFGHIW